MKRGLFYFKESGIAMYFDYLFKLFFNIFSNSHSLSFQYAVLSYGITELYAMGVPIFIPTIRFMVSLRTISDRSMSEWYCGGGYEKLKQHPSSSHPFNPDSLEDDALTYWLQFADFYQVTLKRRCLNLKRAVLL